MNSKDNEYKEIFLAEANESHEELNRLFTSLEKHSNDKQAINAIFRITHTLKGNAAGMGFKSVAELAHVLEDIFGEVREGTMDLNPSMFTTLFKSVDVLGSLIQAVKDDRVVAFRGIKTKLEVMLREARGEKNQEMEAQVPVKKSEKRSTKKVAPVPIEKPGKGSKRVADVPLTTIEAVSTDDTHAVGEEGLVQKPEDTKILFSDLVQVPVRKLDNLLNLVGELIIERDRIIAANSHKVEINEYTRLSRISSDLQYSVMDVRLVHVGFLFNKFHRVVRDAAAMENKTVALQLRGTETEIDRNILNIISDSLIHLIRNAVGHGIESQVERKKAGKSAEGTITLNAFSESDGVIIEISDDGYGINADKVRKKAIEKGLITVEEGRHLSDNDVVLLIFEPGFSTMEQVTAISGRGVGMDVVKEALDSVGGNISVETEPGKGTTFKLRLPASMAVKGTLLLELQEETFAIPLSYTQAVVSLYKSEIYKMGNGLVASYQSKTISIVFLQDFFEKLNNPGKDTLLRTYQELHTEKKLDIVIVHSNGRTMGLVVGKLLQQKEIVEKPLMKPLDKIRVISGVTIMGNGHVCLVLNVAAIFNIIFNRTQSQQNILSYNSH